MDTQTNTPTAQPTAQNPASVFIFPTAGKIFAQAREIYKTKFKSLILISLCSVAVSAVAGLITEQGSAYLKSSADSEKIIGTGLALLIALFIIYISIWAYAATIRNISSADPNTTAGKSFSESSHDIMPLLFTGLLAFLIIFGGTILLIVPGIIFAFWYSQSTYVVITEGLTGKKALDQSKLYAKGNVWEIFKKGFFITIISLLIGFGVGFIFGLVGAALHLNFIIKIADIIFQMFWAPLVAIYAFLLFQYLRQSKTVSAPVQ